MAGTGGRIFLSYRRTDQHIAGRLADGLANRFDRSQVFMDVEAIEPGSDFAAAIDEAVGRCAVLIAVIGRDWVATTDERGRRRIDDPDDFVALEIGTALDRGIRVIPVLVDDAVMPRRDDLPERLHGLARRQAVEIEHGSFHTDIGPILAVVDRALRAEHGERGSGADAGGRLGRLRGLIAPKADPATAHEPPNAVSSANPGTDVLAADVADDQPPSSTAAANPPPTGRVPADPAPRMIRSTRRIAQWWLTYLLSAGMGTSVGMALNRTAVRAEPWGVAVITPVVGGVVLLALVVSALRREIAVQRMLLGDPRMDPIAVAATAPAVDHGHVRRVASVCVLVGMFFLLVYTFVTIPTTS